MLINQERRAAAAACLCYALCGQRISADGPKSRYLTETSSSSLAGVWCACSRIRTDGGIRAWNLPWVRTLPGQTDDRQQAIVALLYSVRSTKYIRTCSVLYVAPVAGCAMLAALPSAYHYQSPVTAHTIHPAGKGPPRFPHRLRLGCAVLSPRVRDASDVTTARLCNNVHGPSMDVGSRSQVFVLWAHLR